MYCKDASTAGSSWQTWAAEDKEHEYRCVDGQIRAYKNGDLAEMSESKSGKIKSIFASLNNRSAATRDPAIVAAANQLISRELASCPITTKNNVFLGCSCCFAPKIEIETALFEPIFAEESISLFEEPIGYSYITSDDIELNPFGVILRKDTAIKILANLEDVIDVKGENNVQTTPLDKALMVNKSLVLGTQPRLVKQIKTQISIDGSDYQETLLNINLRDGKFFIEHTLFEVKGKIDPRGEAHLDNGLDLTYEDLPHISAPNYYIGTNFEETPHFVFEKTS